MFKPHFLFAALIATSTAAMVAKAAHADAKVRVPFSFTVDGKQCPAGQYLVRGDASSNTVTLVGRDSSRIFSWIVTPRTGDPKGTAIVLRFDHSGSANRLRSIQYGAQSTLRLDEKVRHTEEELDAPSGGR
jgi:hypothetical protein